MLDVEPARYTPFATGAYRVEAGLHSLERSFGNGAADHQVFQIDAAFERYLANKKANRGEDIQKYFSTDRFTPDLGCAAVSFMVSQLIQEHPSGFSFEENALRCELTGETILFDEEFNLLPGSDESYLCAFDAVVSQVQEDVCVVRVDDQGDRLVAAHVCSPSHWDPRNKIGENFVKIHEPVAGIEKVNAKAASLLEALVKDGRYQRFGWGVTTDDRLNHHPEAPRGFSGSLGEWSGKCFDSNNPRLFVRVERQTLIGLPDVSAFLFTIRLHFVDCVTLSRAERSALCSALLSMSPEARDYKGLTQSFDAMVEWLSGDRL